MPFLRHCVECPKCLTRYLIGFSPYRNGSCLVRIGSGWSEEYILYCSCSNPPVASRWKEEEIKRYLVSTAAHDQRYGTPEQIRMTNLNLRSGCRHTSLSH